MKPIFVGNFEVETRQSELERLFSKYGKVDRVDMKSRKATSTKENPHIFAGFAFVYFEEERDAEDAIRGLDRFPFGYEKRRLSVEWAKGERGRHRDTSKSAAQANQKPTKTLFVINFDPIRTKNQDIERHFEPHGKITNVRIRRNFGFVQFETQEDATRALECTHMSKILDRVVSVEYALKDDGERRDGSPRRDYGSRRDDPYRRSPSPFRRGRPRGSPDYGRARGSPDYGRPRARGSPDYGRAPARGSPDYGRARARSPVFDQFTAHYDGPPSPGFDRYRSRSPVPMRSRR